MESDYLMARAQLIGERIAVAAVIFIIGLVVIDLLLMFINRALAKSKLNKIVAGYLRVCIKVLLFIILAVIVLSSLGVSVVSLVALISAAAAAIALALQNSLSNLAAGILIIVNKPFEAGDYIECGQTAGVVDEIHLFNCRLHTLDNKYVVIPNNTLIGGVIVNFSAADKRRVDVKLGISYAADVDKARVVLLQIAADNPQIFAEPAPFVGVAAHNDSAIALDYRVWCATDDYWAVFYYLQEEVLRRFREAAIEIPYPQLDVHITQQG